MPHRTWILSSARLLRLSSMLVFPTAAASFLVLAACESAPKKERAPRPEAAENTAPKPAKKEAEEKPAKRHSSGESRFLVTTLKNDLAFAGSLPPAVASDTAMALADLVAKEPENPGALVTYLGVLRLAGQGGSTYDETVRRAGSVSPKNPWFLLEAGYGALSRNDFSLADFLFARAERNSGGAATVKAAVAHAYGIRYLLSGQTAAGVTEIRKAANASPPYLPALLTLGFISLRSGDYAGAERLFRGAVAADSNNANAVAGLAAALRVTGKAGEAASMLGSLYKARNNDRRVAWNYALALADSPSGHSEAISVMNRYFQMPGSLPEIDERANALLARLSAPKEKPAAAVAPSAPAAAGAGDGKAKETKPKEKARGGKPDLPP